MRTRAIATALLLVLVSGCRRESDLGDFQPALDGAARMTRTFWMQLVSGDVDAARKHLATRDEIAASLRVWATVMGEDVTDEDVSREAAQTHSRLMERWEAYSTGREKPPAGMTAETIRELEIMVTNKMVLSPEVKFIQRLTLTDPGVDPVDARVAGAVKVARGPWKILWLP